MPAECSSVLRTVGAALDGPHRGPEVDALRGPVEPGRSDGATLRGDDRGGQSRTARGARSHRAKRRPLRRAVAAGAEASAHTVAGCDLSSWAAVPSAGGSPSPEAALSPTAGAASRACSGWIVWNEVRRAAS